MKHSSQKTYQATNYVVPTQVARMKAAQLEICFDDTGGLEVRD